ncbi:hypothetical protein ACN20G_22830 [Streptomyces sp. BI20]|uniref:hypothetical protein n=1 Tax=Streptomyces sp. BI20 TaxID=3403460 RepID=UPI003C752CAD
MIDTSSGDPTGPAASALPVVAEEPRGCLFALSQPPLMIFLAVVGVLLAGAAVLDLRLL